MDEYETYRKHIEQRGSAAIIGDYRDAVEELETAIRQHRNGLASDQHVTDKLVDVKILIEHLRIIFDDTPDFDVSSDMYVDKFDRLSRSLGETPPILYSVR
ncbi:MAG: hypothetical protein ACTSPB_13690 [Candidatus Thorarchaeota archaeon]